MKNTYIKVKNKQKGFRGNLNLCFWIEIKKNIDNLLDDNDNNKKHILLAHGAYNKQWWGVWLSHFMMWRSLIQNSMEKIHSC